MENKYIFAEIERIKVGQRERVIKQAEVSRLASSIKEVGLLSPILLDTELNLIAGYHRLEACKSLGHEKIQAIIVSMTELERDLAEIDENLVRNELTAFERSEHLARRKEIYEQMHPETKQGGDHKSDEYKKNQSADSALCSTPSFSEDTAKKTGLSERAVQVDLQIAKNLTPAAKAVIRATPAIAEHKTALLALAQQAPETQSDMVEKIALAEKPEKEILRMAAEIKAKKREEARERNEKIKQESKPQIIDGLYAVVVLDPPWPIEKIERDCRENQNKNLDYPTMTMEEIAGIKIPMAENSHVFCWTTQKFLPDTFSLLEKWGVKYVLTMVWHKPGGFQPFGLPQYNCEFCVYGRKGTPKFVDLKNFPACFFASRGEHSEKPQEFYTTIERVTDGRRIDMFSRRKITGFDAWGYEAKN